MVTQLKLAGWIELASLVLGHQSRKPCCHLSFYKLFEVIFDFQIFNKKCPVVFHFTKKVQSSSIYQKWFSDLLFTKNVFSCPPFSKKKSLVNLYLPKRLQSSPFTQNGLVLLHLPKMVWSSSIYQKRIGSIPFIKNVRLSSIYQKL